MNSSPFFSIILPCYNHGEFLGESLGSICAQTSLDWECLVVDDASTDNSQDVAVEIARSEKRIRILHHERNRGLAAARNTAIKHATGRYLVFVDADDLLLPPTLDTIKGRIKGKSDADDGRSIFCLPFRYFRMSPGGYREIRVEEVSGLGGGRNENLLQLACSNPLAVCSAVVPRALVQAAGGFDGALRCLEDYDLWVRLAASGARFRSLREDDIKFGPCIRVHAHNMSGNLPRMYLQEVRLRQRWEEEIFGSDIRVVRANRMRLLNRAGRLLLLSLVGPSQKNHGSRREAWAILRPLSAWGIAQVVLRAGVGLLATRFTSFRRLER